MHTNFIVLGLAAIIATASSSTELNALRSGSAQFSSNLFSVLRKGHENENLVVSPLSLEIALAMIYVGANGRTQKKLAEVLHVETSSVQKYVDSYKELLQTIKDPALSVASTVFVDKEFKLQKSYTTAVSNGFGVSVKKVNFEDPETAAQSINDWCDKHTNGMIKKLYKPDDLSGPSVLVNAVYFKAPWKIQFPLENTRKLNFYSPTGVIKVPTMNIYDYFLYGFSRELNATFLELPYANDKFRMLLILPYRRTALKDVEQNLKTVGLKAAKKFMSVKKVEVYLPRFKIENTINLKSALKKLGAGFLFNYPDLSGISVRPLKVDGAQQKAIIEVTEEGTKAAAVTSFKIELVSAAPSFEADRPFLFHLIDEKDSTLFSGAVLKP